MSCWKLWNPFISPHRHPIPKARYPMMMIDGDSTGHYPPPGTTPFPMTLRTLMRLFIECVYIVVRLSLSSLWYCVLWHVSRTDNLNLNHRTLKSASLMGCGRCEGEGASVVGVVVGVITKSLLLITRKRKRNRAICKASTLKSSWPKPKKRNTTHTDIYKQTYTDTHTV